MSACPTRHPQPGLAGLLLGEPDRADLGVGEGHPADRAVVRRRPVRAEQVAHRDLRLVERHVGEGALPGDVADRPEPLAGPQPLVGLELLGVRREPDRLEPDVVEVGLAAHGDQQVLGAQRRSPPTSSDEPAVVLAPGSSSAPTRTSTPSARSTRVDDLGAPPAPRGRAAGPRPPAASPGSRTARTPAPARTRSARRRAPPATPAPRVCRITSRLVQYGVPARPSIGGHRRLGAGVEHARRAGRRTSCRRPRPGRGRPAGRARARSAPRPPRAGRRAGRRASRGWPRGSGPAARARPWRLVRRVDQQLRRRAAPERALAADQLALDPDHAQPGLGELAGGVLATGAEPEHDDVDVGHGARSLARQVPRPGEGEQPEADQADARSAPSSTGPNGWSSTSNSAWSRPPDFFGVVGDRGVAEQPADDRERDARGRCSRPCRRRCTPCRSCRCGPRRRASRRTSRSRPGRAGRPRSR